MKISVTLKHSDYTYRYVGKTGRSKGIEYMQQRVKYTKRTEVNTLKAESTRRWNRSEQVIMRLQELQTWRHVCWMLSTLRRGVKHVVKSIRPLQLMLSEGWRIQQEVSGPGQSLSQSGIGARQQLPAAGVVTPFFFFLQLQLNHGEDGE